jgi:AcrR family transcriptional regulator
LFVTEGYHGTSVRKIADKIGYSVPTIYFYFKDKADLLDVLCEETFAELESGLQQIVSVQEDAEKALRDCLRFFAEFCLQNPQQYLVTFSIGVDPSQIKDSGEISRRIDVGMKCFSHLHEAVRRFLELESEVSEEELELTSQILAASVDGIIKWQMEKELMPTFIQIENDVFIEKSIEILIKGLQK